MANNVFGIDLGTSNIKIYNKGTDTIFNEKNVIAIVNKKDLFAFGDYAFEMYEKAPENISVTFPIFNGVIADYKHMQMLLRKFLEHSSKGMFRSADYVIAVPTDITEVEKRAFCDLVKNGNIKAKNVRMVEKPVADAVGLGVDVHHAQGVMVVNIGANTTEISILSLGGIVVSKLLKLGGNRFDESIVNIVKKNYNLVIGLKTAEALKKELCSAIDTDNNKDTALIYGRNVVTGLPMEVEISASLVHEAIAEPLRSIIDSIKMILERTPPELAADIYRDGIYITGGSSNIRNMDQLIMTVSNLKVNTCENPEESVARGLKKIIVDNDFQKAASAMNMVH